MSLIFQPVTTTQSALESASVVNGKAYFVRDTEKLFFDYNGSRTEIRDIIILEKESDRDLLLAPKNKFYFVLETSILWLYRLGEWYQVGSNESSNISINTKSYTAESGIQSIQLDAEIPDISSILFINVDGVLLMKSSYSLASDKKTINFNKVLNVESGIDVVYSVSNSAVATAQEVIQNPTNLVAGNIYNVELNNSDLTLNVSGFVQNQQNSITVYLKVLTENVLTINYPNRVLWKNGNKPDLQVGSFYILEFKSIDAGSTIYASIDKYTDEDLLNENSQDSI